MLNKTTETINQPSFMQKSYLWNILWQTCWDHQVPKETWNLWACVLAVNSAQVRGRTTATTRGKKDLKTSLPLLPSQAFLFSGTSSRRQTLQIHRELVGERCCPHFWELLGQVLVLCAQDMTPSPRNERIGTLYHPVFNYQHTQAKHRECFPAAA